MCIIVFLKLYLLFVFVIMIWYFTGLNASATKCSSSGKLKLFLCNIFIPCHTIVAGYYGISLVIRLSNVQPSVCHMPVCPYIRFWTINLSKSMYFHQTWYIYWYCEDLVWDYYGQILTELSAHYMIMLGYYHFKFLYIVLRNENRIKNKLDLYLNVAMVWW